MSLMKAVLVAVAATCGFAIVMMGVDVFVHDATLTQAWKESPNLVVHSIFWVFGLAWQYKIATAVVFGIGVAILSVREVPDIWTR
jgi:hypothetical protein